MNQYSKEITLALADMCAKYKIKRGMLIFEETNKDNFTEHKNRVIVFEPGNTGFQPRVFAKMFLKCVDISKTLRTIMDEVSSLALMQVIKNVHMDHKLFHEKQETKH